MPHGALVPMKTLTGKMSVVLVTCLVSDFAGSRHVKILAVFIILPILKTEMRDSSM